MPQSFMDADFRLLSFSYLFLSKLLYKNLIIEIFIYQVGIGLLKYVHKVYGHGTNDLSSLRRKKNAKEF